MACRICHDVLPPKSRHSMFSPTFGVLFQVAEILGYMPTETDATQHSKYVCAFCFLKLEKLKRIEYDIVHKVAELRAERLSTISLLRKLYTKMGRKPIISIQASAESQPTRNLLVTKILPKPNLDHIPVLDTVSCTITTPALSEHRFKKVLPVPICSKPTSSPVSCNTQQILSKPSSSDRLKPMPSKISNNMNSKQVMKSVDNQTQLENVTKSSLVPEELLNVPHVKQSADQSDDEQRYRCNTCGISEFSRTSDLLKHMSIHAADNKPFTCGVCGKIFNTRSYLLKHMTIHTRFHSEYDVCGKMFNIPGDLQKHTEEKPFKCDVCGRMFNKSCNLQRHMNIHTGEKLYKYDVCDKMFVHDNNLQAHMRIHTGEKSFVCDICGKRFTYNYSLKSHMLIHTGAKHFICDVCGKMFNKNSCLQEHIRSHTGEKPYKCDVCSKMFNMNKLLLRHKRIHTGEKPYKCNVCNKMFLRSSHLQRHMRIHTGEKPFKCDVCSKAFGSKQSRDNHKRIHTGEKPFKCDICGKMFTENRSLQKHMRIHTGEKPCI